MLGGAYRTHYQTPVDDLGPQSGELRERVEQLARGAGQGPGRGLGVGRRSAGCRREVITMITCPFVFL
nr:hypothetical protein GCM10020093_095180 [Planobispora longispora]